MKKKSLFSLCLLASFLLASCASILSGTKAKVTVKNDNLKVPVNLTYDNKTEHNVFLPYDIKLKRGFKASTITASASGYESGSVKVSKNFNVTTLLNIIIGGIPGFAVDAGTGAMMKPSQKEVTIPLKPIEEKETVLEPIFVKTRPTERVTRDDAGSTSLERTIIRWYFDSAPQGARIFWRVISSVPSEVKNTNELWLGSTPFEETRSFNIQGLTYANSRDVQIEIKVKRKGYVDQVKRFNVRQAIDQQEISSFFDLVEE